MPKATPKSPRVFLLPVPLSTVPLSTVTLSRVLQQLSSLSTVTLSIVILSRVLQQLSTLSTVTLWRAKLSTVTLWRATLWTVTLSTVLCQVTVLQLSARTTDTFALMNVDVLLLSRASDGPISSLRIPTPEIIRSPDEEW